MQARSLPAKVAAIFAQIETLITNPQLDVKQFSDLNKISTKHLLEQHQNRNGEKHSLAGWARLTNRQDILDWLYKQCGTDAANNYFILHNAVLCNQSPAEIKTLVEFRRQPIRGYAANINDSPYTTTFNSSPKGLDSTPLNIAALEQNEAMVSTLIKISGSPNPEQSYHTSALHIACQLGNESLALLLIDLGANVNAVDAERYTPLHLAMKNGNPVIIQALVKAGANILVANGVDGNTPLHLAMEYGNDAETFFNLLDAKNNAGVNQRNYKQETPLMLAAKYGHNKLIANWLMAIPDELDHDNNHAFVEVTPDNFNAAFNIAVRNDQSGIATYLLPRITNLHVECSEQRGSALLIASSKGNDLLIKSLCSQLVSNYIKERENGPDYKKHTYFFVKQGAGYSKQQKVDAAKALLKVINGEASVESLQAHSRPLNNKTLKGIYALVNKYVMNHHQATAEQATEDTTNQARQQHGSGGGSGSSSGCDCSGGRRQHEFSYLENGAKCCEAGCAVGACLCSPGMTNNSMCNVM